MQHSNEYMNVFTNSVFARATCDFAQCYPGQRFPDKFLTGAMRKQVHSVWVHWKFLTNAIEIRLHGVWVYQSITFAWW